MLIDKVKEIAEIQGYIFVNGDEFTIDLFDEQINKNQPVFIYYHKKPINNIYNDFGTLIKREYNMVFLLANSSDFNEVIGTEAGGRFENGKYKQNIEPLYAELDEFQSKFIQCGKLQINSWTMKEVYNLLDYNLDGIYCETKITENV